MELTPDENDEDDEEDDDDDDDAEGIEVVLKPRAVCAKRQAPGRSKIPKILCELMYCGLTMGRCLLREGKRVAD